MRLQICSRTFGGYKIGCFVIRGPRLQTAATNEDPGLAIILIDLKSTNFSDYRIKLSSDQSAVGFLGYIALHTLDTYDTPTLSDTHTSVCNRFCIPAAARSSDTSEAATKLQGANYLNRYVAAVCSPTAAISLNILKQRRNAVRVREYSDAEDCTI